MPGSETGLSQHAILAAGPLVSPLSRSRQQLRLDSRVFKSGTVPADNEKDAKSTMSFMSHKYAKLWTIRLRSVWCPS